MSDTYINTFIFSYYILWLSELDNKRNWKGKFYGQIIKVKLQFLHLTNNPIDTKRYFLFQSYFVFCKNCECWFLWKMSG